MKKLRRLLMPLSLLTVCGFLLCSAAGPNPNILPATAQDRPLKIAIVNFKTVVEKSKLGQKEQANFDAMKKQMETVLLEKEKSLNEIASKFNDIDYLDSLSPEAETELKNKFRTLNTEFNQQQNQFYQALSQTNMKIVQKLTDAITKASSEFAKKNQIDIVLNEDSCFVTSPALDVSAAVTKILDETPDVESKDSKSESNLLDSIK
ncbi:MAG: OmpH family outer membrane protein [Parachlamydiaceae bacterium]|nr:OmpH family outer membrane protein [Parachlamydiaceae bacterium]